MTSPVQTLTALAAARRPGVLDALRSATGVRDDGPFDAGALEAAFAAAGRRFGTDAVGGEACVGDGSGRSWSIAGWGWDELARALLLLEGAQHLAAAEQVDWIAECYRAGALRERRAVLRALPLLPDPARHLAVALDACRTSTLPVFEAIACENPYPATHFPEPSFNQMVLKAVFNDVALGRVVDLATRRNPELARMATDYASERAAAGRSIPADLALLTGKGLAT